MQSRLHARSDRPSSCPSAMWLAGQFQRWAIGIAELVQLRGIFRFPAGRQPKWLVLTIDDSPSSRTDEIAALLDRHDVRCTFFVHSDQIQDAVTKRSMRMLAEKGHEIANHMPSNLAYVRRIPATRFNEDFIRAHRQLEQYGNAFRRWFRPPMGVYCHRHMHETLRAFGYDPPLQGIGSRRNHFMASFAPWDSTGPTNTPDAEHNQRVALRYADQLLASLYPGCIVVFHDGEEENNQSRLAATLFSLDHFLRGAQEDGWTVLSIGEALQRIDTTGHSPE